LGFAFQLAAYLLYVTGRRTASSESDALAAAVVAGFLGAGIPVAAWWLFRGKLHKKYVVGIAWIANNGERRERPNGAELWETAPRLGFPPTEAERMTIPEGVRPYCRRVFGLRDVSTQLIDD
jgi:hypothetical protein